MKCIKIKKTIVAISGLIVLAELFNDFYLCSSIYSATCFRTQYDDYIRVLLFWVSLAVFVVSLFTFFISEKVFKRWRVFTAFWIVATTIFVIFAPVNASGPFGIGPTKESVSVWMSILFVIISILMFIVMSIRERQRLHCKQRNKSKKI